MDRYDSLGGEERGDAREPTRCPRCGGTCTYDGWDHVHPDGLGIGSCCGEVCYGRLIGLHMEWSVPRRCGLPVGHKGSHVPQGDDRLTHA